MVFQAAIACAGIETPETDCVLATLDLQQLLDQQGIHLRDAEPDAGVEGLPSSIDRHAGLSGVPGSAGRCSGCDCIASSGGTVMQNRQCFVALVSFVSLAVTMGAPDDIVFSRLAVQS